MDMKKLNFDKAKVEYEKQIEGLRNGGKPLLVTIILTFLVMIAVCLAVFFGSVQGKEQVMVPNVIGKDLTTALLLLQKNELYAKIQLRYTDLPGNENTILEQDPKASSIIKAYQRVTITVDRGVALDHLEDYVGQDISNVRSRLQLLFSSEASNVNVMAPVYTKDSSEAGTILAQYPDAGTIITPPMNIRFVVSSGNQTEKVIVPNVEGNTIAQVLRAMSSAKVVFDFTSHIASESEKAGTVTSQSSADKEVEAFSHIPVDIAIAAVTEESTNVSGIFTYDAPEYPYAVPMQLDVRDSEGNITSQVQFVHPGKTVTVPFTAKKESTLIFSILGEEKTRQIVQ